MTGPQLAAIRRELCGTDTVSFGRALGIDGEDASIASSVRRLETRNRVPGWYARLAAIYSKQPKLMETRT